MASLLYPFFPLTLYLNDNTREGKINNMHADFHCWVTHGCQFVKTSPDGILDVSLSRAPHGLGGGSLPRRRSWWLVMRSCPTELVG